MIPDSPHPEYDRGFSNGWNACEARSRIDTLSDDEIIAVHDHIFEVNCPPWQRPRVIALVRALFAARAQKNV